MYIYHDNFQSNSPSSIIKAIEPNIFTLLTSPVDKILDPFRKHPKDHYHQKDHDALWLGLPMFEEMHHNCEYIHDEETSFNKTYFPF